MTNPVLAGQTWTYTFTRPRRMGWPTLVQRTTPSGRPPSRIAPVTISVTIRQAGQLPPEVGRIAVSGHWARTGREVRGQTLASRPGQVTAIGVDAPDWVLELADQALALASGEE